jgi:DNA-binding CsgD family transcriptional regulator
MTEKEEQFLKLAATELTYKEIADQLNLSIRTVDGYQDSLFQKLNVRSRVGLAMEAVRMNLVTP